MSKKAPIALFVSLLLLFAAGSASAAVLSLDKDTDMHPVNWAVGMVKFKGGTQVTTNDAGEVTAGVPARDTRLRPLGWQRVMFDYTMATGYTSVSSTSASGGFSYGGGSYNYALSAERYVAFKGGQSVAFNAKGEVTRGVLAEAVCIKLVDEKEGYVVYKEGSALTFHENSVVASGTLAEDTWLRPTGWQEIIAINGNAGFVKFKAGSVINFNENGLVTAGTLGGDTKLKVESLEGLYLKLYTPGTAVKFNDKGETVR